MQEYVLICLYHYLTERVLLIKKKRPKWQEGLFNLPGGKVEPGESPLEAATRKLKEETGINIVAAKLRLAGTVRGSWGTIYVYYNLYTKDETYEKLTDEEPIWWPTKVGQLNDEKIIKNLRVIIPLCIKDIVDWEIRLEAWNTHDMIITFPKF